MKGSISEPPPFKPKRNVLIKLEGQKWFDCEQPLSPNVERTDDDVLITSAAENWSSYARQLFEQEVSLFGAKKKGTKASEAQWMHMAAQSGTMADQVAALTLMVQQSALHHLACVDSLLSKMRKKERRESMLAMATLKELFLGDLLPSDRKLLLFKERPLHALQTLDDDARDRQLLLWYFEEQLKQRYGQFVTQVEATSKDAIDSVRSKATRFLYDLLCQRPEQEEHLLVLLTNKLGDVNYKVAATVAHHLTQLVIAHPRMKLIVVSEVERLIYRPNINERAQYYAVCFLTQIVLSKADGAVAVKLLSIYFNLFKLLIKRLERFDHRMLGILLTGTNRALPFAKSRSDAIMSEIDTLYKVVAVAPLQTAVQALQLLYQVLDISVELSDRFYSAVYRKLADASVCTSSHLSLLVNLLYKVIKHDPSDERATAFVKRLLQLCLIVQPPVGAALLLLISEVSKERPTLLKIISEPSNLTLANLGDDEQEHFKDIEEEADNSTIQRNDAPSSSWVHVNSTAETRQNAAYNPHHRNPMFAGANFTASFELAVLRKHFHPSLKVFAEKICQGEPVEYSGDPLEDFSLIRFLDRFVFRNPKKDRPGKGAPVAGLKKRRFDPWAANRSAEQVPVTSDAFMQAHESDVRADERFLHRYLSAVGKPAKKAKTADDSDVESIASDEFESFLEKIDPTEEAEEFDIDFSKRKSKPARKKHKANVSSSSGSDDDGDDNEHAQRGAMEMVNHRQRPKKRMNKPSSTRPTAKRIKRKKQ